jgi:hypothetical protein
LAAAREWEVDCGAVTGRLRRLVSVAVLVACAVTSLAPTALASNQRPRKPQSTLRPLWSAFPLDQTRQSGGRNGSEDATSAQSQPSAGDSDFGTLPLFGAVALVVVLAGGIALVAVRRPAALARMQGGVDFPNIEVRLPFRPSEGGSVMSNPRRRLWARSEPDASADQASPNRLVDRVSEYAVGENRPSPPAEDPEGLDQPVADEAIAAGTDVGADLSAVGNEVGAVLKSAQEAAATIRRTALEEATKQRDEVEAAAAAELAAAQQAADAERQEAHQARAEAEAYAGQTRAAAEEYAEQRRAEAERESATIVAEARSRLEEADAEVERKIQIAEAQARTRVDMLKAETERYEERLENIFVVFREMSSQLEELLGTGATTGSSDEGLDDALRPDPSTSRAA